MTGEAASYFGNVDHEVVTRYAARHGETDNDDDKNMFSSIFSKVLGDDKNAAEEDEVKQAADVHERVYSQGAGVGHSSRDMGIAAAMQAFKMFSGGGGSKEGGSNELIGMAMGEAMKLFNSQSGAGGNVDKGEMLQQAAMMAMKLFMAQKQGESGGGGGTLGTLIMKAFSM